MFQRLKSVLPDFLAITVLILLGALTLNDFSNKVDINLTDDTGYLTLGLMLPHSFMAGFGPLYSVLFKVLKQIIDDPVVMYDTAIRLLIIAPPVCAYIFLRAMNVQRIWALLICGLYLFSPVNMAFITWSKISHYSICIIFLWAAWVVRIKEPLTQIFSLSVLAFLLGYVRPEYHLTWYLSFVFLLAWWWYARKSMSGYKMAGLVAIQIFLIVSVQLLAFINPMSGGRTYIAFAQQFSYNYCEWNQLTHYDWIQWRDIAKKNFGSFQTLGQAFSNNPEVFIQHVLYNFGQYFIKGFEGVRGIFFPPSIFGMPSWLAWIMIVVLLTLRILHVEFKSWKNQLLSHLKTQWILPVSLLLLSAPSVMASMLFYTREHYLVLQMPLVFLLIAWVLHPQSEKDQMLPRIVTRAGLPIMAGVLFLLRPHLNQYKTYDVWEEYTYPSNRETIKAVRALGIQDKVMELDHEGGFAIYIGKNYKWATAFQKEEAPYSTFIERYHPNMYYVTKALLSNRFFYEDPEFMYIIQHPDKHGFHRVDLDPRNKGYLLISNDLKYEGR
jgi:hypothetical protein